MNDAIMLSSIALGISVVVSAIKMLDWWLHTDPRSMIRTGKLLLFILAAASVPVLIVLLVYEQWALAMLLGAAMLIVPVALNWRRLGAMRPSAHATFRPAWSDGPPPGAAQGGFAGRPIDDGEIAARAALVLEAYLDHVKRIESRAGEEADRTRPTQEEAGAATGGRMSRQEALDVLGLPAEADAKAIRDAHRRLVQIIHPDRGGTNYLAAKINEAKETLLAGAARPAAKTPRRGSRSRRSAETPES